MFLLPAVYIGGAVITYNLLPNGYRERPAQVVTYCGLWPLYGVIWGVAGLATLWEEL